jgi:hypothetical protein
MQNKDINSITFLMIIFITMDETISYTIEEIEDMNSSDITSADDCDSANNPGSIEEILEKLDQMQLTEELAVPYSINYYENYTVKELLLICDYYGFSKFLKSNKLNKEQIVECLVNYETSPSNADIVLRRQNMWFYMNELKNDKFMKKFVLW